MKLIIYTCACIIAIGLVVPVSSQELNSTLHSTFYGVHFAYVGETVTFTCVTRGSNGIAWSSDEYIGSGGVRLEFIPIDMEGATQPVGQTVATLVRVSYEDGEIILVTQLQISVESTFQTTSITCHSLGNDAVNTISFLTADNTSVICDKPAACPGETVTCTCTTAHSNTIAWSSDEQDDMQLEFASVEPVTTRRNVTNSSTFAVLTDSSDVNGVVVLMSDLTFIASENPANLLTCLNSDLQSSRSIIVPVYRNYETDSTIAATTSTVTNTLTTDAVTQMGNPTTGPSVDVIVGFCFVTLVLVSAIIVLIIAIIVCGRKKYINAGKRVSELEQQLTEKDEELIEAIWRGVQEMKFMYLKKLMTKLMQYWTTFNHKEV